MFQIAGEDVPEVPVAVEYRDHTDARLQEVQTQAQLTIASLTVRVTSHPVDNVKRLLLLSGAAEGRGERFAATMCCVPPGNLRRC